MQFAAWEILVVSILIVVSVGLFARDFGAKIKIIRKGKSDLERTNNLGRRLWVTFKETIFQTKVIGARPVAGILHAFVFLGFVVFGLETIDHFFKAFGIYLLSSLFGGFAGFYKNTVSFWAILVLIGIIGLALRRFVFTKWSPDPKSYSSGFVALLIVILMATYLFTQTAGYDSQTATAKINWWAHALTILVFPHLILRSKHLHLILSPADIFFRTERIGDLQPVNLDMEMLEEADEDEISLGLETLTDLSWKQRLDFFTCVECRRCTDNCPANISEQELDPRGFILQGRNAISTLDDSEPVIGNVISETALGQCTSCGACENICPVGIEHLQVLTGAKRAQAMALGTGMVATDFLQNVERSGNPLGGKKKMRDDLISELEIPFYEKGKTEYLLWLGCVWNYNNDLKSAAAGMVKILKNAGVSFGVLRNEKCSGHHSRRQGEEMQFQTLAEENINQFKSNEVKKVISPCPHCLHTMNREYPTLDDDLALDVIHHSSLIGELMNKNLIQVEKRNGAETTFHDPCYLGRYEKIYDAPRNVVQATGLKITEMTRHGERSMCCGGGNAGFNREQDVKKRVDQVRKDQVRETGAKLLVTACPECKMMLNAAVEETKDIAEVVADALVENG